MGTHPLSLPPLSLPTTVSLPRAPISRADHNLPAAHSLMINVKTGWVLPFFLNACQLWGLLCRVYCGSGTVLQCC